MSCVWICRKNCATGYRCKSTRAATWTSENDYVL